MKFVAYTLDHGQVYLVTNYASFLNVGWHYMLGKRLGPQSARSVQCAPFSYSNSTYRKISLPPKSRSSGRLQKGGGSMVFSNLLLCVDVQMVRWGVKITLAWILEPHYVVVLHHSSTNYQIENLPTLHLMSPIASRIGDKMAEVIISTKTLTPALLLSL